MTTKQKTNIGRSLVCLFLFTFSLKAWAYRVGEIDIADTASLSGEQKVLHLQGAAVRSKYFIDVYLAGLYTSQKVADHHQALDAIGPKQMRFHILMKKISKERFQSTWRKSIKENNSKDELSANQFPIEQFVQLFDQDFKTGDVITIDFLPKRGTQVTINGKVKGRIKEDHLFAMVLKTWLGKHPPSKTFRTALTALS